jgi:hypothetical protein
MNRYYIYFHINPVTEQIFYIGKGRKQRAYDRKGRNIYWQSYVLKYGFRVEIIENQLEEQEAFDREKYYINKIGPENLCNVVYGGDVYPISEDEIKEYPTKLSEFKEKEREESKKELEKIIEEYTIKNSTVCDIIDRKHRFRNSDDINSEYYTAYKYKKYLENPKFFREEEKRLRIFKTSIWQDTVKEGKKIWEEKLTNLKLKGKK